MSLHAYAWRSSTSDLYVSPEESRKERDKRHQDTEDAILHLAGLSSMQQALTTPSMGHCLVLSGLPSEPYEIFGVGSYWLPTKYNKGLLNKHDLECNAYQAQTKEQVQVKEQAINQLNPPAPSAWDLALAKLQG